MLSGYGTPPYSFLRSQRTSKLAYEAHTMIMMELVRNRSCQLDVLPPRPSRLWPMHESCVLGHRQTLLRTSTSPKVLMYLRSNGARMGLIIATKNTARLPALTATSIHNVDPSLLISWFDSMGNMRATQRFWLNRPRSWDGLRVNH